MKKRLLTVAAVAVMSVTMSMTAFAGMGSWQQDANGWWWQRTDGSYPAGEWKWIDGNGDGTVESYYFDQNGYLITNATTPDGYTVNADGAWVVDGVVQKRAVMLDLGDDVLAAQTATQTNTTGNPVMDGKSIEKITFNQELVPYYRTQDGVTNFPTVLTQDKIVEDTIYQTHYEVTYKNKPLKVSVLKANGQITRFLGTADQILNGLPEEGIELGAFYDNCGYDSISTGRRVVASTGNSDEIFKLPSGSYRWAQGTVNGIGSTNRIEFFVIVTQGSDGNWYIYPDNQAFWS